MEILTIDIGSYSVKFLLSEVERKKVVYLDCHEVLVSDYQDDDKIDLSEADIEEKLDQLFLLQLEIISDYLQQNPFNGKIVYQVPHNYLTTRLFELPLKNKKKIEQMIPFQLDEDLPYPVGNVHYAYESFPMNKSTYVIASVMRDNHFQHLYNEMVELNVLPHTLTSEESINQSIVDKFGPDNDICILNLGHMETKGFFFSSGKLVASQTSYVAGQVIDEVIEETYQISKEEAVIFKHQNAFMLTDSQYEMVDEDQVEFARLMKSIFQPLILEFKRWSVAHRLKTSRPIDRIYLTGGTSQIKNIDFFLSEALGIPCVTIPHQELITSEGLDVRADLNNRLVLAKAMALNELHDHKILNLRSGEYAPASDAVIPAHSIVHHAVRVLLVCLLLTIPLVIERFQLSSTDKKLNAKLSSTLKNASLGVSGRERAQLRRKPQVIMTKLERKMRSIKGQEKEIHAIPEINAIKPLSNIVSSITLKKGVGLEQYSNENGNIKAIFESNELKDLDELESQIKQSSLENPAVKVNTARKKLTLEL